MTSFTVLYIFIPGVYDRKNGCGEVDKPLPLPVMNDEKISTAIEWFRRRLQSSLPGNEAHSKMFPAIKAAPPTVPANAIASAVMAILFLKNDDWHLLVMRRIEDGRAHSGQISFPGGRYEISDIELQQTALRETFEEIGLSTDIIEVAGGLTPLYVVVSNYHVFPFIGFIKQNPAYILSKDEVHEVFEIPLGELFNPAAKVVAEVISPAVPGVVRMVNAYRLKDGTIIWGATAMMIAELEILFKEYLEK